jgi:2-dehydropantoate 2-reductase
VPHGPILIVGCGAVGGYLAAHLQALGQEILLLEPWAANREAIAAHGLRVEEPDGERTARAPVFHTPAEVAGRPLGLVILCSKLFEAMPMVAALEAKAQHRGPYLATLNGLADVRIGAMVGPERVMGCIVTGFFGELVAPGLVRRHRRREPGGPHPLFRLCEVAGPPGERVRTFVALLGRIDAAEVVADLPRARWTKLVFNAMTSALAAVHQRPTRELFLDPALRVEMIELGLEAVRVATLMVTEIEDVCGVPGALWHAAANGEPTARAALDQALARYGEGISPTARSGMAQDLERGRPTEVDLLNGAVVEEAEARGLTAPANRAVIARLHTLSALQRARD